jgi:hypothetical protein
MSGAFVIEIEDRAAGLALAEKGGFLFRASDPIFRKLDGHLFQHVRQARTAAAQVWREYCARTMPPTAAQHSAQHSAEPTPIQISWGRGRPVESVAPSDDAGRGYVRRVGT